MLNDPYRRLTACRRKFMLSPINVLIKRSGILYYTVSVSRGANTLISGYDHDLTNIRLARRKASDLVEVFKHKNSNTRINWVEELE